MPQINKILFVTLSNIGDVILTLPALDILRHNFPRAKITVLSGLRPKQIFENNPGINKLIVYNKRSGIKENIRLFRELKKEKFDLVVDLRNSLFGALIPARYKTSPFLVVPYNLMHMKYRHLYRLPKVVQRISPAEGKSIHIRPGDEDYLFRVFDENKIKPTDKIVVIAPGARSHTKRWSQDKFADLSRILTKELGLRVILVGDENDISICAYIAKKCGCDILDLSGKTSIAQLALLLKRSKLLVTNDSAILHLASYLNVPVVGIFGPTNELKYGPWSEVSSIVKKDIICRPCEAAQCKFKTLECLNLVKTEDVLKSVKEILNNRRRRMEANIYNPFKRILLVRTDRIGDVALSTPVIKALRETNRNSYIAMMVSPYAKEILEGGPYLDEIIIYDKNAKHKGLSRSIKFSQNLKKKFFDLAVILHPTNRVHLTTFFARIPKRIGYDRNLGLLLTQKLKHTKQFGEKHELEYNLDLLRPLGIETKDKKLYMPLRLESEEWIQAILRQEGVGPRDKLLAIHPGASCPSKVWPEDRFARVADSLAEKYGFKVLLVAGPKDLKKAEGVLKNIKHPVINLAGRTSVSQLASVLKRCSLFISNDSGPVHISSAVGTPVISIFGRNQKGLSPKRWGPTGLKDRIVHKEVGCIECLAHNCVKEFACLKAISVDDVVGVADSILQDITV